jgi:hypothetical protein
MWSGDRCLVSGGFLQDHFPGPTAINLACGSTSAAATLTTDIKTPLITDPLAALAQSSGYHFPGSMLHKIRSTELATSSSSL